MELEDIRAFCLSMPGVTESIKWGDHLCFCVADKLFIITSPDRYPVNASFKTSDDCFQNLIDRDGIIPAPYMARNKWVMVDDIALLTEKEWKEFLQLAYSLVFAKLPKKVQREISG